MTPAVLVAHASRRPLRALAAQLPALLEALAVVVAIALLLPSFSRLAANDAGRDRRFAETAFRLDGLPEPALPGACDAFGALADAPLRERLCGGRAAPRAAPLSTTLPVPLAAAVAQAARAFEAPLRAARDVVDAARAEAERAGSDVRERADAATDTEAAVGPFIERFGLDAGAPGAGPAALACAAGWTRAALADTTATRSIPTEGREMARADALLLFAAALDGRSATEALANATVLPDAGALGAACAADAAAVLGAAAAVMGDARQSVVNAQKNEAMRALAASAGAQWATAMALGFALLALSRRVQRPLAGAGAALLLWTGAAWCARVPWPFAAHRGFEPARLDAGLGSAPALFVLVLAGLGAALVSIGLATRRAAAGDDGPAGPERRRDRPHGSHVAVDPAPSHGSTLPATLSSRIGYAGLVVASGLGCLLILELSANGHPSNRYLALYHQGHLWLGMTVFSILLFLRRPLARQLAWTLTLVGEALRAATRRLGARRAAALLVVGTLGAVVVLGLGLANMRQLTSELGRVWLIVGAAWFFYLRAGPLTERLARDGPVGASFWRYAWPMLFVVAVLVVAMLVTRDMGPLLIAGYGAGAFLAATLAMWWHQRSGARVSAFLLAVGFFAAWIVGVSAALFELGSIDGLTATRLESVAAPFASTNDQLALVAWFQRAAPGGGFGLGNVPWCGFAASPRGCPGVPAQIHSDYTFTALVGVFGAAAAWAASLGCALWLHRLVRHHGRVTRGEPRLVATATGRALDGQAFVSWIGVAWVALTSCQLAVTVAGNVAVLPLTGVTFPFVGFGMTSLLVNLAFLALCLSVDASPRSRRDG